MPSPDACEGEESGARTWEAVLEEMRGAYADITIRLYRASFATFEGWCAARDLNAAPAASRTVADFIDHQFESYAAGTIRFRLQVIRAVHRLLDLTDPTPHRDVQLALRRGLRKVGARTRQAYPLNAALRDRLLSACPTTLLGLRDEVLIRMGYDTLCRRSELVRLEIADIMRLADGTARLLVRAGKSDPFRTGDYAYVSVATVAAIDAWLARAELASGPILRARKGARFGADPIHPVTLTRRLRRLASRAGVDPVIVDQLSGHSFRVGAIHDLIVDGRSLLEIMRAGRWRSLNAIAGYARDAPVNVWASPRLRDDEPVALLTSIAGLYG